MELDGNAVLVKVFWSDIDFIIPGDRTTHGLSTKKKIQIFERGKDWLLQQRASIVLAELAAGKGDEQSVIFLRRNIFDHPDRFTHTETSFQ